MFVSYGICGNFIRFSLQNLRYPKAHDSSSPLRAQVITPPFCATFNYRMGYISKQLLL